MDGVGGPLAVDPAAAQQPNGEQAGDGGDLTEAQQEEIFGDALLQAALPTAFFTFSQVRKIADEGKDIVED